MEEREGWYSVQNGVATYVGLELPEDATQYVWATSAAKALSKAERDRRTSLSRRVTNRAKGLCSCGNERQKDPPRLQCSKCVEKDRRNSQRRRSPNFKKLSPQEAAAKGFALVSERRAAEKRLAMERKEKEFRLNVLLDVRELWLEAQSSEEFAEALLIEIDELLDDDWENIPRFQQAKAELEEVKKRS